MDNPGTFNLGDRALTTALTGEVITAAPDDQGATQGYLGNLDGMRAVTLDCNFVYGSGGTSCKVTIETTLNQGMTWIEVARAAFTTASAEKVFNLSGLTEKVAAVTPGAQSDDAALSGVFGDRWRAKVTSVGTYGGNTSVSVRINAR